MAGQEEMAYNYNKRNLVRVLILMLALLASGCDMIIDTDEYQLIKKFEGFKSSPYQCSAGRWTIGYGTTIYPLGAVQSKDRKISKVEAHTLLHEHVRESILPHLTGLTLNNNQREALISFIYNIGSSAFKTSTLRKKLVKHDYKGASNEFLRWNKANGKVLAGLTKRRKAEKELFLKPVQERPVNSPERKSFWERIFG